MKIIISTTGDISKNAGTIVRAKRIFEIFKERYDVTLIARPDEKKKLNGIIKLAKIKLWCLKVIPLITKRKINCVYCSNDWFVFPTYWIFSKICGYTVLFEAHAILSAEAEERHCSKIKLKLYKSLERFVIKHADYVIALSENTFTFYEEYNKNIDLNPVFIDENVFKINKEIETKKYQRDFELIGLIGPFNTIVNECFLDFLYGNIKRFDDKIKFIIIGRCDNKIENERITYTGYLENFQDYVDALSDLDAVLVPSKIATLGPLNKIIEPMSCSLPVFTTPKGMVGLYYVEDGKNIFVFEDDELVNKVNELIFDGELMKKIGKNARIVVEKYYSKKTNEKKLINTIENINANKGGWKS